MRKGLFLGTLLATMLVGGTAFAERNDSDHANRHNRGKAIKEQVLQKQKEGFGSKTTKSTEMRRSSKERVVKERMPRQKGEIYGDQATRSTGKTKMSAAAGKNMSASNRINTPSEVRAMLKMINPMLGAYRTAAGNGTDSYGGNQFSPVSAGSSGGKVKNMSATNKVNTPAEIKAFIAMIAPMKGAYSTCAAAEGTDSYSDTKTSYTNLMNNGKGAQRHVHFKNEKGEVIGAAKGGTDTASKSKVAREKLTKLVQAKMEKAKAAKN